MPSTPQRLAKLGACLLSGLAALLACSPELARAQASGQNGYAAVAIDGIADVGAHFALTPLEGSRHAGLFYLSDRRELWGGDCSDSGGCRLSSRISPGGADHGRFPSIAMRAGARPIGAYFDADAGDLRVVYCLTTDCEAFGTALLDATGRSGEGTAIAIDPSTGFAAIAYRDGSAGSLRFYRCANFDCTNGNAVLVDAGPQVGANPSLTFDSSGRAFIVYDDDQNAVLKLATAAPGSMSFTTGVAAGGSDGVVVVDSGNPMIYYRDGFATLRRRNCLDLSCSVGTDQQLSPLVLGAAPSVVRDAGGVPAISHRNADTGEVYLTRCADAACTNSTRIVLDARADGGRVSQVVLASSARPRVFWHQTTRTAIADALCANASCTSASNPRIALNGPSVADPALATRADGSPVLIYRSGRGSQRLAVCANPRCTAFTRRELPGLNSLDRGSVIVRVDDRPLAFYGSLGGTVAYDCLNTDCTTGVERAITPSGSGTAQLVAAVLRSDNRPLLVYVRRIGGQPIQWRVFVCADEGCASGTDRLLVSEASDLFIGARLRALVGPGDRLIVVYSTATSNFATYSTRYLRCVDPDCTSATVGLIGNAQIFDTPIALRSDGRVVFRENVSPNPVLATCGSPDCPLAGIVRVTLPIPVRTSSALVLDADRPVSDAAFLRFSGLDRCVDASCTAIDFTPIITDPELPDRFFSGTLARDAALRPIAAWAESTLGDLWLSVPLPEPIFANGFEP